MAKNNNLPKLQPGDLVAGRFRIVEIIGSGGFSVVYRAHQEARNRFVALKVLKPAASNDAKIVERFRREALYASHLSHPNTITLFDYGHTEDLCYIAMEYLEGFDLSEVVQKHVPMDLKRVWKILVQSCRSLAEAHRLGLVHRDLKPENIFLVQNEDQESVKVLDFGVSKAISSFGDAGQSTLAPLTQEGTVFGTPLYMAPEQAMAESTTPAVDVYALGHIMFEMITGYAAYDGATNAMDVMLKQINDPPLALPSPWKETPFSQLVTLCTQKDPGRRVPDAGQLLDRLLADEFEPWADPNEQRSSVLSTPRIEEMTQGTIGSPNLIQDLYSWELGALEEAFKEALGGALGRVVLVSGAPGTGRSTLAREFLKTYKDSSDVMVLHRPYHPAEPTGLEYELSLLCGEPIQGSGVDEIRRILQVSDGETGLERISQEFEKDSQPLETLTSLRNTLFRGIGAPFREVATQKPIIWVIENVERQDVLTLAFLDRFIRDLQANPCPVLIVATVYPEHLKLRPGVVRYTQELMRTRSPFNRHLVLVPPVNFAKVVAPAEPEPPPEESVRDTTIDHSTLDHQDIFPDADTEQVSVRTSPEEAFDRILGFLAQLGDDVPLELWKLVSARVMDIDLIRLVDMVAQQAERFGIVTMSDGFIRFAKPGFASTFQASFDAMPGAARLHHQLAEVLEEFHASPSHEEVSLIARHWCAAGRIPDAIDRLVTAGDRAFQSLNLDGAREYFLQVQKLFDASPDVELRQREDGLGRAEIWLRLGEVHGALDEFGASEDALQRVLTIAKPDDRFARGRAQKLLGDLAASQDKHDEALQLYELARLEFWELGHVNQFANITVDMAQCALWQGHAAMAEDLGKQALDLAPQLADQFLVGRIQKSIGQVLSRRNRFAEAKDYLEAAKQRFENLGRKNEVTDCYFALGVVAYADGDYTRACERFSDALSVSPPGLPETQDHRIGLSKSLMALGRFEYAEGVLRDAFDRASNQNDLCRIADIHVHLSDLHFAKSDWETARDQLDRVTRVAESIGQFRHVVAAQTRMAYIAFHNKRVDEAYDHLSDGLEYARRISSLDLEMQLRAHLIYLQLLQHGFRAQGDTFASLLQDSVDAEFGHTALLCYLFKADCEIARGHFTDANSLLRYARVMAARTGDYAALILIARRQNIINRAQGQPVDVDKARGFAIGSLVPPEVARRRFDRPAVAK